MYYVELAQSFAQKLCHEEGHNTFLTLPLGSVDTICICLCPVHIYNTLGTFLRVDSNIIIIERLCSRFQLLQVKDMVTSCKRYGVSFRCNCIKHAHDLLHILDMSHVQEWWSRYIQPSVTFLSVLYMLTFMTVPQFSKNIKMLTSSRHKESHCSAVLVLPLTIFHYAFLVPVVYFIDLNALEIYLHSCLVLIRSINDWTVKLLCIIYVQEIADFDLHFEKVYKWTASSVEDKEAFISCLWKVTQFLSFFS